MRVIKASYEVLAKPNDLCLLELAGRTCYKSDSDDITPESSEEFVSRLLTRVPPHESVIEHLSVTVKFVCDRGVSHELVRHRVASFSQESTRYCCYAKDKFGAELTFIEPSNFSSWSTEAQQLWTKSMNGAERTYMSMLNAGLKTEEARSVLPNSLKTEVVMTANFREWRHVFELRTSERAHPDMRTLMRPLRDELAREFVTVF